MPAEVTWVGPAVLVEIDGVRVLRTRPRTRRVVHLRRRGPLPPADVRRTDLIVISHAHYDHLHRRSLRRVWRASPGVPVVVAARGRALRRRAGPRPGHRGHRRRPARGGRGGPRRHPRPAQGRPAAIATIPASRPPATCCSGAAGATPPATPTCSTRWPTSQWSTSPRSRSPAGGMKLGPGHLDETRAVEAVASVDPALVLPIHWGTYALEVLWTHPARLAKPLDRFADALGRPRPRRPAAQAAARPVRPLVTGCRETSAGLAAGRAARGTSAGGRWPASRPGRVDGWGAPTGQARSTTAGRVGRWSRWRRRSTPRRRRSRSRRSPPGWRRG